MIILILLFTWFREG